MADGEMTLKFDSGILAGVAEAAASAGLTPETWAEQLVREAIAENEKARWAVAFARADEHDRTGGATMSVDEAFDLLDQLIDDGRAA